MSQLLISRMPKMRAIPQLVSAPLNPIPIAEHFRRSHPPCEHSHGQYLQHIRGSRVWQSAKRAPLLTMYTNLTYVLQKGNKPKSTHILGSSKSGIGIRGL